MANNGVFRLRKGFDIKLQGEADKTIRPTQPSTIYALRPPDFKGIVPRMDVAEGDAVLAGQSLFHDKDFADFRFASPVSGEVVEVLRGAKRRIMEIRVLADKTNMQYKDFGKKKPESFDRTGLIAHLMAAGCWPFIRQRPFDLIARPTDVPKAIFVSGFDSSPLAPDLPMILAEEADNFSTGLDALQVLSGGKLHLSLRPEQNIPTGKANVHRFSGPHPAGNVGIQIHHIAPLRGGEVVWYVHAQDVLVLGRLFNEGKYRPERVIAVAGSEMRAPYHARVQVGQKLSDILDGQLEGKTNVRTIQGNVLVGQKTNLEDCLGFYTRQLTAIPEGNEPEFLGWIAPGLNKLSLSRSYFSWLFPKKTYNLSTNLQGEERPFVVSGQYEQVLPMDIMPVQLLKAILAKDIERMEQLGIHEVSEEDFALCEFVCTSKIDVQNIIRQGLDMMLSEQ